MAVFVLAVVIFLFDNLREKRSVLLTKSSRIACFKNSCSTPVEKSYLKSERKCNIFTNTAEEEVRQTLAVQGDGALGPLGT